MSARRFFLVLRTDFAHFFRRPLAWIWIVILGFTAVMLATGDMRISSGDSTVGGTKAWLTSEFAVAQMLSMVIFIFYMFFVAIASGMTVIRDEEEKVGEILHATPLSAAEYIWGKFGAGVAAYLVILAVHLLFTMAANHLLPSDAADEIRGPFRLANYLIPGLVFGLPTILFFAGTTFAIGAWSRRPILVFVVPVAAILICPFFLWSWSPHWMSYGLNRLLMLIEPSGFRWLNEMWVKVDKGVDFYNTAPISFDAPFLLSRLGLIAIGLACVALAERRFARAVRGRARVRAGKAAPTVAVAAPAPVSLRSLGMNRRPGSFVGHALTVWRFEARELWASPGLYLFIPIILLQILGNAFVQVGVFGTHLLVTPGLMAVSSMNTITLLVCLLLLFYTVESLSRERNTGAHAVFYATPVRTGAVLLGKALANSLVAWVIYLASFLACVIAVLVQHKVALTLTPFLVAWVLLLTPTFLAWSAFVMAVQSVTSNRYTTYALGLGVLILSGWLQVTGRMNWVGNWDIWSAVRWSDFGIFELNRTPLLLNRLLALSLIPLFIAFTVRTFDRRQRDATRTVHRLSPGPFLLGALKLSPWGVVPLVLAILLFIQVDDGWQGKKNEKLERDYWKANVETWKDAPLPATLRAETTVDLYPESRRLRSSGTFVLYNHHEEKLQGLPVTMGAHWDSVSWTLNGEPVEPVKKSFLYVFEGERGIAPGETLTVGWEAEGPYPKGATRNGGGAQTFVVPMGVVLTTFDGSFTPLLGFQSGVGLDEDHQPEAKRYPEDFYKGITPAAFGSEMKFPVRTVITGPEAMTLNGVGTLVEEHVENGRRTAVWESDYPVAFYNVVAGRWDVRRGEGTAVYYHPSHTYNIDEMVEGLDAARKYYSEWFYPFPWKELKLSEFPNLASYAQGFATNITFSEGIGFLTRSDPRANAAFMVTAHESAHQWWGNLLMPGKGPGDDVLSEGKAHFSTALLFEQVKGPRDRMEFLKAIEADYAENRQADSEQPLYKYDGTRPGDRVVVYDKGGWVFWMLLHHMGRDQGLAGIREFLRRYVMNPDHPVLQDYTAVMREFAPDTTAYDAFVREWFAEVNVPEYRVHDAKRTRVEGSDDLWEVVCRVENRGTGRMPVEIAAVRGERFPDADSTATPSEEKAYREARTTVEPAGGETVDVTIRTPFEPERIVVDPDVMVLMLERKRAVTGF